MEFAPVSAVRRLPRWLWTNVEQPPTTLCLQQLGKQPDKVAGQRSSALHSQRSCHNAQAGLSGVLLDSSPTRPGIKSSDTHKHLSGIVPLLPCI